MAKGALLASSGERTKEYSTKLLKPSPSGSASRNICSGAVPAGKVAATQLSYPESGAALDAPKVGVRSWRTGPVPSGQRPIEIPLGVEAILTRSTNRSKDPSVAVWIR